MIVCGGAVEYLLRAISACNRASSLFRLKDKEGDRYWTDAVGKEISFAAEMTLKGVIYSYGEYPGRLHDIGELVNYIGRSCHAKVPKFFRDWAERLYSYEIKGRYPPSANRTSQELSEAIAVTSKYLSLIVESYFPIAAGELRRVNLSPAVTEGVSDEDLLVGYKHLLPYLDDSNRERR